MIYIVNKNDKIVGFLKNNDDIATPYFNDVHTNKIAETDQKIFSETLEFTVPYGYDSTELLDEGMRLLKQDTTAKWKLFTIYQVEDSIEGLNHHKKVFAINSLIFDMNHRYVEEKTFSNANSNDVFAYIFQQVGWNLNNVEDFFSGGTKSYTVTQGKRQAALDEATKEFSVEVEAYVVIKEGNVLDRRVNLSEKIGESTGRRFEYRHNLKGATRTKSNDEFYTKLHVFGGTKKNGDVATITEANKVHVAGTTGKNKVYEYLPFLVDDKANDKYNGGNAYLEGYIQNDKIISSTGLLEWGKKQLKYYNHPHYTYEVEVALLGERVDIGDSIAVIDFEMEPAMTVSARVLETNYSDADSSTDTVVLGEYVTIDTITPNLIWELKAMASQALGKTERIFRVETYTPDGLDFEDEEQTKQIIVRVYDNLNIITDQFTNDCFIWQKINEDGSLDEEWASRYANKGSHIEVNSEVADCTIRCIVDGEVTDPVRFTKEEDFYFFSKLENIAESSSSDLNKSVAQYAHVDYENQYIYWSQVYKGSLVTAADKAKAESFTITRTNLSGKIIDRMLLKYGGHGSHFGLWTNGSDATILTTMLDVNDNNASYSCTVPYTPNATFTVNSSKVMQLKKNTVGTRLNYCQTTGHILEVTGSNSKTTYKVYDSLSYLDFAEKPKLLHEAYASNMGIIASQTYQSSCLDYPYLYTTFGGSNGSTANGDHPVMLCYNLQTNSIVYQIDYTFTHEITPDDDHHEAETINYFYDTEGIKKIVQGFAFSHENENLDRRNNMLYVASESVRSEEE